MSGCGEPNEELMDTGSDSPTSLENIKCAAPNTSALAPAALRLQNPANTKDLLINHTSPNMHFNDNDHFLKYRVSRKDSEDYDLCHTKKFQSELLTDCFNDSLDQSLHEFERVGQNESQQCENKKNEMQPKVPPTLTYTSEHPLMNNEVYYPDIVPEKSRLEGKLSLSVDDKYSSTFEYGPQRNTSKNNLYFSDNFSVFDDHDASETPDVAKVIPNEESGTKQESRKIVPLYSAIHNVKCTKIERTPGRVLGRPIDNSTPTLAENLDIYVEQRNKRLLIAQRNESVLDENHDADQTGETMPIDIPTPEKYISGPVEWAESPSHLRSMSNIELPVELSSHNAEAEDAWTPEPPSPSDEHSPHAAAPDPARSSAALRHASSVRRRLIAVARCARNTIQPEDAEERLSVGSGSACSLDELPLDADLHPPRCDTSSDDDSKREPKSDSIAEYSGAEENARERSVKRIRLHTGETVICDMKVIEPYQRVLSHGGYTSDGRHVVVLSACYLPDHRTDYNYVLDNLALYVMWTLERLVAGDYVLVYLAAPHRRAPSIGQLEKLARRVDYRLRKSLRSVYVVHGSWWLRTLLLMMRAFVSSKLWRKVHHVRRLAELHRLLPGLEPAAIPQPVRDHDNALQH